VEVSAPKPQSSKASEAQRRLQGVRILIAGDSEINLDITHENILPRQTSPLKQLRMHSTSLSTSASAI
jgi:hypothetical protein